ncbi:hypothetical protein AAC387_Pa06g3186 [Persea americana]
MRRWGRRGREEIKTKEKESCSGCVGVVQAKNEKEEEAGDAGRTVVQAKKEKEEEASDAGRMQGRGAACR